IDRGPDSKGVIDLIWKLQKQGLQIKCIKGNHEDYCIKAYEAEFNRKSFLGIKSKNLPYEDWKRHGAKETLYSFDVQKNFKTFPKEYIDWMKNLNHFVSLDNFLLVHAGFNFKIDNIFEDTHAMMWIRSFQPDLKKTRNRKVIHGHVPVSLEFIELQLNKPEAYPFIALDNGVYMKKKEGFGNLVALEINSMNLVYKEVIDLK
ncbi:MAG: metallophosphoesterase, partial [Bacteroidales bacterium]